VTPTRPLQPSARSWSAPTAAVGAFTSALLICPFAALVLGTTLRGVHGYHRASISWRAWEAIGPGEVLPIASNSMFWFPFSIRANPALSAVKISRELLRAERKAIVGHPSRDGLGKPLGRKEALPIISPNSMFWFSFSIRAHLVLSAVKNSLPILFPHGLLGGQLAGCFFVKLSVTSVYSC
jgi:hypothetical protein